ncbi:hypothetical protein [Paenibacillus methanolicus]|uniref:Heparinase II/III-like protein n=1 Tax=Paenibacillus methanolicus TaxID=582686 RepID=A0A5S5C418_9BACL|nr:hypothetical protein [Paenibacillus methanolicus]TYP73070.1 hypothetical protein BCM02_10754 [Paenibacillus methanolicus]
MQRFHWERELLQGWLDNQPTPAGELYARSASGGRIDWAAIAASPGYDEMKQELLEEGSRLADRPIPELTQELYGLFEATGNRLAYEGVYFERRRRLTTFALLHLLFPGEPPYARRLEETIESILAETTWCLPAHMKDESVDRGIDLFAAETGFALGEIAALIGERLPRELTDAMKAQVNRRLFVPYLTLGPYHWETAEHNWAAVCAGSIGAAALLIEPDAARRAAMCAKAVGAMNHYLSGFGEDGACLEGPGYWNYGFGYYVYFADLLRRATGGRADLFEDGKVRRIALFQQQCYLAGNRPANFSDAMPRVNVHLGLSDYLAALHEETEHPPLAVRAAFLDDHCARFAPALRNVIWFRPEARRGADWQPGSWYLPDAQWMISRRAADAGTFGFAAKGGTNDEPHNHNDVGHFILLADDDPAFAADLGCGEYTAQYFGADRYAYDCTGAHGHSLPMIDGRGQASGAASHAIVLEASTSELEDRFVLELAACYPASGLVSLQRSFDWVKSGPPRLTLTDTYRFAAQAAQITECIVTRCRPRVIEDGRILIAGTRHTAVLEYEAGLFEAAVEERMFANHYGVREHYYRLQLIAQPGTSKLFAAELRFVFR